MSDLLPRRLDDYVPLVGEAEVGDVRRFASYLKGARIQHVNSTRVGGGVAELLRMLVPLMRDVGLDSQWDVMQGNPDFFRVTKAFHNALHGGQEELSPQDFDVYRRTTEENRSVIRPGFDFYAMHDPQPAGLVGGKGKWVWRCHIDLSESDPAVWGFLRGMVERYHGAIFHLPDYAKELPMPQFVVPPAIDPLTDKNRELPVEEIRGTVGRFGIDPGRPIVLQVSRFDRLKDPVGVVQAFRIARRWCDCQLVLAGGGAADDPEGERVLAEVREAAKGDADIHILALPATAHREINALQRAATVVVQKSLREGFGLVVTEAMWKGKPVIGGAVGGIRRQIVHGATGFLVNTPEGTAVRIRQLLVNKALRERIGANARQYVKENFLPVAYLKQWLMVLLALERGPAGLIDLSATS